MEELKEAELEDWENLWGKMLMDAEWFYLIRTKNGASYLATSIRQPSSINFVMIGSNGRIFLWSSE